MSIMTTSEELQNLREAILEQMPPETRFTPQDARVLQQYRQMFLGLSDALVTQFYDMLYQHHQTRQIFTENERAQREVTLRQWWQRVCYGPIDDHFWDWMTFVGLVHVVRGVHNPMMISAWGFVSEKAMEKARASLPPERVYELQGAMVRFGQTFSALITESYLRNHLEMIAGATGTDEHLVELLVRLGRQDFKNQIPDLKRDLDLAHH
ncbi:protoglobin domain-containing protein [Deinococcus misasensis]|uniref:protoglobin domain-containing protein n=1 Tax=Deinococcus misasensis TaxID=392413 RepID=UPI0006894DD7|nr:protoglobin domain-containing protein [Deinococcus misasensis]